MTRRMVWHAETMGGTIAPGIYMKLHALDITTIFVYLLVVSLIGFLLRRRAARSLNSYLLGGKELPWSVKRLRHV